MAREGGWKVRKYLYRECSLLVSSVHPVEVAFDRCFLCTAACIDLLSPPLTAAYLQSILGD